MEVVNEWMISLMYLVLLDTGFPEIRAVRWVCCGLHLMLWAIGLPLGGVTNYFPIPFNNQIPNPISHPIV